MYSVDQLLPTSYRRVLLPEFTYVWCHLYVYSMPNESCENVLNFSNKYLFWKNSVIGGFWFLLILKFGLCTYDEFQNRLIIVLSLEGCNHNDCRFSKALFDEVENFIHTHRYISKLPYHSVLGADDWKLKLLSRVFVGNLSSIYRISVCTFWKNSFLKAYFMNISDVICNGDVWWV